MLNSETLEVAVGMIFLFLLMSLICTAVKEWIEGVLKWRAMDLERALRALLDDGDGTVTAQLLRHPLIYSLFQGTYDAKQLRSSWMTPGQGAKHMRLSQRRNLPSYIPAGQFASALLDLVARGPVGGGKDEGEPGAKSLSTASLRERAAALPSPHLRRVLLTAMDQSGDDLDKLKLQLQTWYDGTMDRASGWYKRRTQSVLFLLGVGVAVVLNVDALHIMERLTLDKTLRDAVVKQAAAAGAPGTDTQDKARERLQALRDQVEQTGMPVGWKKLNSDAKWDWPLLPTWSWLQWIPRSDWVPVQLCERPAAASGTCTLDPDARYGSVRLLLGWLVTALAIMLGAPFWFDVLNKFMVIRSTVKPHEKSPEEGSEDRADKEKKRKKEATTTHEEVDQPSAAPEARNLRDPLNPP